MITGCSFGAVILAVLFLMPAWTHLILLVAIYALCESEFAGIVKRGGYGVSARASSFCGVLFLVATALETPVFASYWKAWGYPAGANGFGWIIKPSVWVMYFTPAVLITCAVLHRKTDRAMEGFALGCVGFWYVAVLLGFLVRIAFEWPTRLGGCSGVNYTGRLMLLAFVCIVKFSDIGAYAIGTAFGRHKLIPSVSPNKTVEGLVGGYVFSLAVSMLLWTAARFFGGGCLGDVRFTIADAVALPIVLTTAGVMGDLAESLMKRSMSVKDSGKKFPGMGGILDIMDSLLFAAPFMYVYIIVFMK